MFGFFFFAAVQFVLGLTGMHNKYNNVTHHFLSATFHHSLVEVVVDDRLLEYRHGRRW
jgi:hypothetical protein